MGGVEDESAEVPGSSDVVLEDDIPMAELAGEVEELVSAPEEDGGSTDFLSRALVTVTRAALALQ